MIMRTYWKWWVWFRHQWTVELDWNGAIEVTVWRARLRYIRDHLTSGIVAQLTRGYGKSNVSAAQILTLI